MPKITTLGGPSNGWEQQEAVEPVVVPELQPEPVPVVQETAPEPVVVEVPVAPEPVVVPDAPKVAPGPEPAPVVVD